MATRSYETERVRVHWESVRCIHVARCLQALPEVFDVRRRPWVAIEGAGADEVARTVELCPTGALRYERLDGEPGEEPESPTRIFPARNGPLLLRGRLRVETPEGELLAEENRLALCRCGASSNQPFCDNSHRLIGFRSGRANALERRGSKAEDKERPTPPDGEPTTIVATRDGPLHMCGHLRVERPNGDLLADAEELWFCRCGQSGNKPFCDGSHKRVGFRSAEPQLSVKRQAADSPASFETNEGLGR